MGGYAKEAPQPFSPGTEMLAKINMNLIIRTVWLLSVSFVLSACGGNGPPASPSSGAPVTETGNANTASIGARGGQVIATGSNGVTYTLIVPPDALKDAVNITLTPIASMGNAPLAAGVAGAVQMEPTGLQFFRAATLSIGTVPTVPSGKKLFGFTTANDGSLFALSLPNVNGGVTELSIYHFSGSGIGTATPEEIAQVPALVPLADLTDAEFKAQVDTATLTGKSDAEIAEVLKSWFAQVVKPLLDAATDSTDFDINNKAEFAFERWFDAREAVNNASVGGTDLTPLLADQDGFARPIVARHVLALMNDLIARCQSDTLPDLKMDKLRRTNDLQREAKKYGFDTAGFGLENATFLRKVNDCARVVIDPIAPFTPVVIGSDKSLDARALIVFVGVSDPQNAGFAFTVSATGATVNQARGFSSADGRYTTALTPTTSVVVADVQACLVFPGDTDASEICATQQVAVAAPTGVMRGSSVGKRFCGRFVLTSPTAAISDSSTCGNAVGESGTGTTSFTETYVGSDLVAVTASGSYVGVADGSYELNVFVTRTIQVVISAQSPSVRGSFQLLNFSMIQILEQGGVSLTRTLTLEPGQYQFLITTNQFGIPSSNFNLNLTFGP